MPMMTKDEFIHQKEGVIAISRPQDQTFSRTILTKWGRSTFRPIGRAVWNYG